MVKKNKKNVTGMESEGTVEQQAVPEKKLKTGPPSKEDRAEYEKMVAEGMSAEDAAAKLNRKASAFEKKPATRKGRGGRKKSVATNGDTTYEALRKSIIRDFLQSLIDEL